MTVEKTYGQSVPLSGEQFQRANRYIYDQMNAQDREVAEIISDRFADPHQEPLHNTAVLIPVLAHQDYGQIHRTVGMYAAQRGARPFSVLLYLNGPTAYQYDERTNHAISEVERAQTDFPHMDIRYDVGFYDEPKIGTIRRDLWNGAFLRAYQDRLFETGMQDIVGINNDIDTVAISPHYIARIQQHYAQVAAARSDSTGILPPAASRLTHAVLPTHPNVGKVTRWIDNSNFQASIAYEAGLVFPFSHYADRGGFLANRDSYETENFTKDSELWSNMIPGAQMYTSPRRYIERLRKYQTDKIWAPGTFGPEDTCRVKLPRDISADRADFLVEARVTEDVQDYWIGGAYYRLVRSLMSDRWPHDIAFLDPETSQQSFELLVETQTEKAKRLLGACGLSELTISYADFFSKKHIAHQLQDSWADFLQKFYGNSANEVKRAETFEAST